MSAFGGKADISDRRWSIDPTRMTQSGHEAPLFVAMHANPKSGAGSYAGNTQSKQLNLRPGSVVAATIEGLREPSGKFHRTLMTPLDSRLHCTHPNHCVAGAPAASGGIALHLGYSAGRAGPNHRLLRSKKEHPPIKRRTWHPAADPRVTAHNRCACRTI